MKPCLAEAGYEVQILADGGITGTVPPAQRSSYDRVLIDCEKRLGFDLPREVGGEEYGRLYDQRLALKECLEAIGYEITEPPSRQVFIASQGRWQPYEDLNEDNLAVRQSVAVKCPQV